MQSSHRDIFLYKSERNYIMQVVCEATQTSEIQVSTKDFQFLKAMQYYFGVSSSLLLSLVIPNLHNYGKLF